MLFRSAIALAMGRQGAAEIGLQAAGIAILLAIAANTVVKTAMGWTLGGRALGGRLAVASTLAMRTRSMDTSFPDGGTS